MRDRRSTGYGHAAVQARPAWGQSNASASGPGAGSLALALTSALALPSLRFPSFWTFLGCSSPQLTPFSLLSQAAPPPPPSHVCLLHLYLRPRFHAPRYIRAQVVNVLQVGVELHLASKPAQVGHGLQIVELPHLDFLQLGALAEA